MSEGNGSGKAPLSKGVIITRSSVWATYEVLLTLMPVLIWLFIIYFSKPEFEISLQFPAFSFSVFLSGRLALGKFREHSSGGIRFKTNLNGSARWPLRF